MLPYCQCPIFWLLSVINALDYMALISFFLFLLQNKEFVCRGHDYERLEAFQQRMLNEFPHAIAMQHANQPDETIFQAEAQCIHT